jgi:WD40 repeat protein
LTAWWTDAIGQKHHRIVGDSAGTWKEQDWHPLPIRRPPTPVPLALVHPERVVVRMVDEHRDAVVCCPCGVIGMPAKLAWMGTCCGPCHDRRLAGETEPPQSGNQAPMSVAWSANLETLVMLGFDAAGRYVLHVQDVPSNRERSTHTGHFLGNLALSPDGNLLAMGGWRHDVGHGQVLVWDLAGEETRPLIERISHDVWSLAFSPDGQTLAVAIAREGVRLVDPATSELKRTLGEYFGCHDGVAFHPNGRWIAAATNRPSSLASLFDSSYGYAVGLWDATTGELLQRFAVHCYVPKLAFSPDGRFLAVWAGANADPDVVVWDVENCRQHLHLSEPVAAGSSVLFTPNSRFLGCYTRHTGTLCLWDLINGERRCSLHWAGEPPSGMKFTRGGDLLVARKMEELLECWPRSLLGLEQESELPRSNGGGQ